MHRALLRLPYTADIDVSDCLHRMDDPETVGSWVAMQVEVVKVWIHRPDVVSCDGLECSFHEAIRDRKLRWCWPWGVIGGRSLRLHSWDEVGKCCDGSGDCELVGVLTNLA